MSSPHPEPDRAEEDTVPVIQEGLTVSRTPVVTGAVRVRIEQTQEVRRLPLESISHEVDVERVGARTAAA